MLVVMSAAIPRRLLLHSPSLKHRVLLRQSFASLSRLNRFIEGSVRINLHHPLDLEPKSTFKDTSNDILVDILYSSSQSPNTRIKIQNLLVFTLLGLLKLLLRSHLVSC